MPEPIRIGVSACLAGERVRHDGTHRRDTYLTDVIAKHAELVPTCPEIACGMGIPREALRQVDCAGDIRLIGYESGKDYSKKMTKWADRVLPGLAAEELCGFVVKNESASCGASHVKVYQTDGKPPRYTDGFFTRKLKEHNPLLPVVTAAQLRNPLLRENFIRRVFVLKRWHELMLKGYSIGNLVNFHTRHKMMIRAHDLAGYKVLGRLLGQSNQANVKEVFNEYASLLFKSLTLKATPKKNSDVLTHAMGFLKDNLENEDWREIMSMIATYRNGKIPLIMPQTLINHYARKYDKPYLTQQFYFNPPPAELQLLNHV